MASSSLETHGYTLDILPYHNEQEMDILNKQTLDYSLYRRRNCTLGNESTFYLWTTAFTYLTDENTLLNLSYQNFE